MLIGTENLAHRSNNFDFIRMLAAFLVFLDHGFQLFTGHMMEVDPIREIFSFSSGAIGVQVFFCLSGFLVSKSLENTPHVFNYLRNRCLRIIPGLAGVIVLSVFVLGLFFSTLDFKAFISSKETLLYLQNILIYRSYYYLPGVFEGNMLNASVNGSLWSIPYEFTCYLLLPLLFLWKAYRKYVLLFVLLAAFIVYGFFEQQVNALVIPGLGIAMSSFVLPALFFLSGSCYYLWRERINYHWLGIALCVIFLVLVRFELVDRRLLVFILPYLLFAFAFSKTLNLNAFGKYGDFSYGFYLYAFPVQQAVSSLWAKELNIIALMIIAFLLTILLAVFSWYMIEKPALSLKQKTGSPRLKN
ncbi:MAG: putative acyltransferase [Crocinitomicaceae bacterium]|jgi:peptidoglycan/LPS O-acetylase OafA/YrhL|nr:putative acyltransferase [Crocinitomicaceae bacterium]